MAGGDEGMAIIWRGMDYRAPTGEGEIVRTADGRYWRSEGVSNFDAGTGVDRAWRVGDRLVPWGVTVGTNARP